MKKNYRSVADIYPVKERGRPLSIYFAGSFTGPMIGMIKKNYN